ncbi:MAG: phenylalanine--tRNA ligase subunit alpha [Leptospiraceae bacterium]|nr:phenylalanine--tRNA ligase subunit alpha [Leptospiraceae bacterium]
MADLIGEIQALDQKAAAAVGSAANAEALQQVTQDFVGKKGALTQVMKQLGSLSAEERGAVGKAANEFKLRFEALITEKEQQLTEARYATLAETEFVDMSVVPAEFAAVKSGAAFSGHIHPISRTQKQLEDIFTSMGFSIVDGPQVEDDYHNFGALNFTDDHPARDMQDTFYTTTGHLLRTHTSTVQIRALERMKPPLRIIAPGRVFRYEEVDASHEHTFYQMEGMIVDRKVSVGNLLHLMQTLLTEVFGREVDVRLRPGYFPFVEPGFELDMKCLVCDGKGCPVCKHSGWVEVLPCGLVHPNVLKSAGLDPNEWQGAAFGLGLNRLVMMQHGIEDIRHFMAGKLDFLKQF